MNKIHIFYDYIPDVTKSNWERRDIVFEDPREAITWIRKHSWNVRVRNIKEHPFSHPNKT
jgi:hypothetical protein